jgi:predicted metal-dependent phosphoesterase TrpH
MTTSHIDLHTHSSFSDGMLSPSEIVARARQLQLAVIALTDHDTTAGISELLTFKEAEDIEAVPGIELSAHHELAPIHILGYGIKHDSQKLQNNLIEIQNARRRRNIAILDRLQNLGFTVSLDDIPHSPDGQIGRPHIAGLLVKKGVVFSEHEAFAKFIGKDKSAYVAREQLPVMEAISMINQAGGLAVLAHPAVMDPTCIFLPRLIKELRQMGLSGVEVYHPTHNAKHIRFFTNLCLELNLAATGGSDFHGRSKDKTELGQYANKKFIDHDLWINIKRKLDA